MKAQPSARIAPAFVWSVWSAMTMAALYIAFQGRDYPYADDWLLLDQIVGLEPISLSWLWKQWGDHRIPIVKLVIVPLYRLASYDCRSAICRNVLVMSALSAAMIEGARRLRGRVSYSDAFFPLAFLHWSHNYLGWGFQFQFVASTALAGVLLLTVLHGERLELWSAIIASACLVSLPLFGANGLALVPSFALWFLILGLRLRRSEAARERTVGWLMIAAAITGVSLVPLYYIGFHASESAIFTRPSAVVIRKNASLLMSGNFGSTIVYLYFSGPGQPFALLPRVLRLIEPGLMLLGAATLAYIFALHTKERFRALGLLLFLSACFSLIAGLAFARESLLGPIRTGDGYSSRYHRDPNMIISDGDLHYNILVVPTLCCVYFGFVLAGIVTSRPRTFDLVNLCLFLMMGFTVVGSVPIRLANARRYRQEAIAFEHDVKAGKRLEVLAKEYREFFYPSAANWNLVDQLRRAHDARIGRFGTINDSAVKDASVPSSNRPG